MRTSTDRILTTHVGSLARPTELLDTLKERENGRPYDADLLAGQITEAVADRVQKQVESGIDIVTDGEMSKTSFIDYVKDRLAGFEVDPSPSRGHGADVAGRVRHVPRRLRRLPQEVLPHGRPAAAHQVRRPHQLRRPRRFKTTSTTSRRRSPARRSPTCSCRPRPPAPGTNEHYSDRQEYLEAIADAMREEYLGIVDAGFILQVDDPGSSTPSATRPSPSRSASAKPTSPSTRSTTRCGTSPPTRSVTTPATASTTDRG